MVLLFLSGCSSDDQDRLFDDIASQTPPTNIENYNETEQATPEETPESDLYGTLTVLTTLWDSYMATMANLFMDIHPDVQIIIEELDDYLWRYDIAQQTALITRLLANPPDIFNTSWFTFEKTNLSQLFLDLNVLIDGPNGVNREDYFDNVLRGSEVNGNLYSVPLMIGEFDAVLLNKQYFEAIGVPIDDMRTITLSQFLDYHQRASLLFPEDDIGFDTRFHMFDAFRFERVHDVSTGIVNANTQEMRDMLEYINSVRIGRDVYYMPESVMGFVSGVFGVGAIDRSYTHSRVNYMYHSIIPEWVFFMQGHPDMRFSHPVHRMTGAGDIMFRHSHSFAISRGSENRELAWEFIRFCMEFSENLFDGDNFFRDFNAYVAYPINRHLFKNQFGAVLDHSYRSLVRQRFVDEANREVQVQYAISRFIEK